MHSIFTHFLRDRSCEICLRRAPCRPRTGEGVLRAEKFGDLTTAEHKVEKKPLNGFNLLRAEKGRVIYTDKSLEFGKSCEDLSWNHRTSTPHRSDTNGTAERAVRRVKEGTSAVLLQSGLDEKWWADSMECYCYLRNVQDLLANEKPFVKGDSENHVKVQ